MINVEHLKKHFGPITAVDDVSFSMEKGEVVGLLGPNGAGKSTTMKMITGFLDPDEGTISVCGKDIATDAIDAKNRIGYLAEHAPAYGEMTVTAFLNFICDVRQINGTARRDAMQRVVEKCAITPVMQQTIGTLSKGYQRRVGLAQALIHDPEILVLDEPTDGLDPNQKHEVRQLIKKMAKDKCILISTHILEEVEAICSRTIIIAHGKVLVDSTPGKLKEEHKMTLDEIFRKITCKHSA